ncbi:MAG: hypothetical protein HYY84_14940 [Deltaproteobacteria bacterium]|nr:hypothetical protein [Deltaproteobacteria bacterium]
MEEKRSNLGLYVAIVALIVSVVNIFFGTLPAVEMQKRVNAIFGDPEGKDTGRGGKGAKAVSQWDSMKDEMNKLKHTLSNVADTAKKAAAAPAVPPSPPPAPPAPPAPR